MPAEAWAALSAIAVALITGPILMILQRRGGQRVDAGVAKVEARATQVSSAVAGVEALLPVIENLQRQSKNAEARERKRDIADSQLRAMLAAHGQWDLLVLAEVRRNNRDFPDPPPLTKLDKHLG